MSKRVLLGLLVFGMAACTRAQTAPETTTIAAASPSFDTAAMASPNLILSGAPPLLSEIPSAFAPNAAPSPAAGVPSPTPRFIYGTTEDFRWDVGIGLAVVRFRSSLYYATAPGVYTDVAYFTNEWFAIEGSTVEAFSPTLPHSNFGIKFAEFGGGARVEWRRKHFEPWMHVIAGGAHVLPRIAPGGQTGYEIQAGGGVDYRLTPQFGLRVEGDWVRTGLLRQSQNNAQGVIGVVIHF